MGAPFGVGCREAHQLRTATIYYRRWKLRKRMAAAEAAMHVRQKAAIMSVHHLQGAARQGSDTAAAAAAACQ